MRQPGRMRWSSLALILLASACGAAEQEGEPASGEMAEVEADLQLVPGERSAVAYPEARLGVQVREGEQGWELAFQLQGFEPGVPTEGAQDRGLAVSDQGQHLHVIVDNQPYEAVYDVSAPFALGELEPGRHVVRAFPSRQWHESVKAPGAFAVQEFAVGGVGGSSVMTPDQPVLTYSRPKGLYEGPAADSIMVDFYLTNVELEPGGDRVVLTVDGDSRWEITRWTPHFLVGLAPGEHVIELQLVGPDGAPVEGAFNRTSRTIEVRR